MAFSVVLIRGFNCPVVPVWLPERVQRGLALKVPSAILLEILALALLTLAACVAAREQVEAGRAVAVALVVADPGVLLLCLRL